MINLFQPCPSLGPWWNQLSDRGRIITVVMLTWLPLLILSVIEGNFLSSPVPFYRDVAVTTRFLISLPLMLLIPSKTGVRISIMLDQFVKGELVIGEEAKKFNILVANATRAKTSMLLNITLWIIVYALAIYVYYNYDALRIDSWRANKGSPTKAGWWLNFVAHPIYLFTFFSFLWRSGVWWWIMLRISMLDLNIRPAHGDDLGGLGFIGGTIRAFSLPALAFSISFAAGCANLVLYENLTLEGLKVFMLSLIVILTFLFIGPMLFFYFPLSRVKRKFVLQYNVLASHQIDIFEKKWLEKRNENSEYIEDPDFSAVIDLNTTVTRVSQMKLVPIRIQDLYFFLIAIVTPFLPVMALTLSWKEVMQVILRFLHL